MTNLTQWKKEAKDTFADHFLHHPAGVWRNGKIVKPDFRPLTFNNVNAFLDTLINRIHAHTLEEVRGKVEGWKLKVDTFDAQTILHDEGYNQALDEVLELLEHPTD